MYVELTATDTRQQTSAAVTTLLYINIELLHTPQSNCLLVAPCHTPRSGLRSLRGLVVCVCACDCVDILFGGLFQHTGDVAGPWLGLFTVAPSSVDALIFITPRV